MIFAIGAVIGIFVGILICFVFLVNRNPYNNPNYTPLADEEMRRLREKAWDYYNNPVVNHLKKTDKH